MKALITAGGHGTRLRPITYSINKHLIPLANKPMIFYALEKMSEAGIEEVFINVNPGEKHLPQVIGDGSLWNLKIKFLEQTGGPKGLAHILKIAKPYLEGAPFLFYLGDNIFWGSLSKFIERFQKEHFNSLLLLSKVSDPQRFGVPEICNGKIVQVEEKPQNPKSQFAVTGIYLYDTNVFKALDYLQPSARGEYEISDVHTWLIKNNFNVGYEEITGWWKDTGKPEDLLEGNALILAQMRDSEILAHIDKGVRMQGKVKIGKDSRILGKSSIVGPVAIGEECIIKNAKIGPNVSIGSKAEISNIAIENSIVFNGVKVAGSGSKIKESLIGAGAEIVSHQDQSFSQHKLIIGDHSFLEI